MLKDFKGDAREIFGEGGLLKTIGKRAIEAALEVEMTHHLGYPRTIRRAEERQFP